MLSRFLTNLTAKSVLIVCISAALLAGGAASFVTQTATVAPPTKTSKPVKLQIEGRALKFTQAVPLTSTRLEQTSTQPLTLATADFDEDGTPDLLSGAVNAGVGFVSYYRGNVAAISTPARLGEAVLPFFSASHFVNLPARPDFLVTGDFNADGHTDVVAAARGGSALYLLAGDGKGGFAEALALHLDGEVTAFSAGEFNHADGLTDMAVALSTRAGGQVLLFSDAKGAWLAQPLSFDVAQAPTAMEFGQLTPDSLADLAVAAGNEMVVLEGSQASPRMTRTQLTSAVVSLTIGRFRDHAHDQVALLAQDGSLSIATHSRANVRRQSNRLRSSSEWQVARIFSNSDERPTTRATRQLMRGRISGGAFDDLLTLQGNQLQCVTIQNTPQSATVALEGTDDLVTALPLRMSPSPLQGVVFLRQNESAPLVVQPEAALTFTVNSTGDEHDLRPGDGICTTTATGAPLCTLRAAIEEANANPGADTINFNIGPGTQTIYLSFLLPFITEALTIDGSPLAPAPATQSIVVNGERIPGAVPGSVALFTVTRGNTVIRGLTISAVSKINGISLAGGSQSFIEGNTIRDTYYAIAVVDSARNTIGGTSPDARNVIAGNSYGIFVQGALASNNRILGNYIGTDATGTRTVGNRVGIFLSLAPLNTIGGTTATARNVISGNLYEGIYIDGNPRSSSLSEGADMNTIQGNYIGTDATGNGALGNGWGLVSAAVSIDGASNTTIGGVAPGAGNVIANNYREGIWVLPLRTSTGRIPLNNAIQGNSIYNNGTLGIDLDAPGVTANDAGDGDSGANNLQNFPIITSAITRTNGTTITGTLNSKPNSSYVVDIFANRECDPSGNGEGETFVTRVSVTTDNTGNGTFTTVLETPIPSGQVLTATATDANGNTSEFSPCRVVRAATVDLSITKTASPATVIATQPLTYTITVSNAVGADPATGVVVTDVLPAGLSFSSATTSQGTCSTPAVGANGTVTCALGTITATNTATITLRVILTGVTGGALSNTATVRSNETDSNPTNSTATQTTTVSKANTTVALASSPNPAGVGQPVTFTATVAAVPPGTGTPTGEVVFVEGETTLGTAVVSANGQASFTTANLALGSHSIVAKYGGDASFNPSTSPILVQEIVSKANTSVTLTSSANPAGLGQAVTFTATVTAAGGIPTGTVTFVDGETTLGNVPVNANGQATLTTASLALGNHPIVAQYGGSANFNPSNSATLVQVIVIKGNTTITLTSSQNPASLGQAVTFTATVAVVDSGTSTPSGSVTFVDGSTTLGSAFINANGQATFTTSSLLLGAHPIVAQYSGDTNFNPSTSAVLVQVINTKAIATVVLISSVNPASLGQAVTFTATVTGGPGLPIGVVTFADGNTPLGSSALNVNGQATFTTSSLTLGEHPIVAQYSGDALSNPSTSAVLVQVINNKASTSVALTSSSNPASLGQAVTFTATVTGLTGLPSGTITFVDGTTLLGTVALNNRGQATFTTSSLTVGSHPIVAQYGGDGNFNGSTSAVLTQIINTKARATVILTTSLNPASLGQAITFTATVTASAPGTGLPSGTVAFMDGATTLGISALTTSGQATFTTSSLALGEHPMVAQYSGDTNVNPSVSDVLLQVVNTKASTNVVLLSSENPAGVGQAVTFTASVAGAGGTPSGVVTFIEGETPLGSAAVNASGQATLTTSSLTLGEHLIVAQYSGDGNFNPSTSAVLIQVINNKASTGVTITSSANPASLGQAVTFTATVVAGNGTPSGSVMFVDGNIPLGSRVLNANGQATFTTSSLLLGTHPIVAQYGGDANFNGSSSAVLVQTINTKSSASVRITSSANPASVGQAVTFTATVITATAGGTPTGSMTFVDGSTTLGSAFINANGQATFTTSSLALGNHPIAAQYSGDANVNPSTSAVLVQVINTKASTSIVLTSSENPAGVGQAITFTAIVTASTPGTGLPSGTVTLVDGETILGTVSLSANGQATLTTANLGLGTHVLVAQYNGDANFNGSTSAVLTQIINSKAKTTVALSSSANPAGVGQAVTFAATVAVVAPGTGTPSGTVTFMEGATNLGNAVVNANGQATLTTANLALGSHGIVAQYSGDGNFNPSTSTVLIQIINSKVSTSVVLTSSANPAGLGQAVTFTATVTANALETGIPSGTVTFVDGATTLGSALVNANGQATFTTSSLTLGEHPMVAQYSGDGNFNPSVWAALVQVINSKASTSVVLLSSENPAGVGQAVTFTAVVTAAAGLRTGQVTFREGTTTLGSAAVNANGQATFTTSSFALGEHPIVAQYSGDGNFNPSTSAVLVQVINTKASATITLTTSLNPASLGQAVTFTATVTATAGGVPTGSVTLVDGTTTLGLIPLNANGQATFTTSALTLGEHPIVALYGGDANFNPSTSAVLVQIINSKAESAVTLSSSANPASRGQSITLTATVTGVVGRPTGQVTFVEGATILGSASVNADGQATLTLATLTLGEHLIVAQYGGDVLFNPSTSAPLTQVINTKASASVALTSSQNPASLGQAITLTATVVASSGTPSGSVTFVDGATTLGTVTLSASGQASLTTANLALGEHAIVAQYSGDANVNPSISTTLTQVINSKASTSVTLISSANPASLGQPLTFTATVTGVAGLPTGVVTLVEGNTTLGSAAINANGQATLTTSSLILGEHPIVAQYGGNENFNPSASAVLVQVINSKASTSVVLTSSVNPAGIGQAVTFTASVAGVGGTPGGTVTFREGESTLGSATVNANGQASFTTTGLALGEHPIVAHYNGDTNFNPSTSSVLVQVINSKASTSVTITSSVNPASVGQAVTFTVTVVAGSGTPSGSVTLVDGNTMLGSSALNANGQATFTTSNLTLGEHPMVAQYGGDANFNPSASAVLVQTINTKASTGVVLLSSENPAGASQAVTFTAVVSAAAGSPTGQVTFREGTTTLGSAAVNASGQATLTTSSLTLGEHPIVAQYEGDVNFNGSASAVLTQVINTKASAGVAITSSVNPASLSQAVTFTATVSGLVGLPTGVVTFVDGTTTLGSSVLNASGQATFTTSALTLGEHPMVALYSGDTLFNPRRSDTVLQVVNSKASTTIALRSLANPAGVGQAVIFTATVAGAGGTPGGTITFREGATMLGSSSLNANGQATFTPSGLALGDHLIVAQYSGDTNFNPSTSSVLVQVVNTKSSAGVLLTSSANPASVGQAVTFTATVTGVAGLPIGMVTFVEGNTTLGSSALNANGQATFTTSSLTLGEHVIVAQYSGDILFNPSTSAPLTQVINTKASTSVALTSSANPAGLGQAVTFTATVTPSAPGTSTPSGTVTLVDGETILGTVSLSANGQVTLTTSSLGLGTHVLVAQYSGDANFNPGTSPPLTQGIVVKSETSVTLTSSANPASLGQAVTLTATVRGSNGTPSGVVTFVEGTTTLGSAPVTASGEARFTTTSLALGNHEIVAQYSGDTNFNPSTSSVLVQVVNTKPGTAVTLSSSANPASVGQTVTFTATVAVVAPGTGTPSGTVTFVEGTSTLGSASVNANGQATLTLATLVLGEHLVVAQYGGDANFNGSTSAVLTQVINTKSSASVALSSSVNPASLGQAVTFTATVTGGPGLPLGVVTFVDGNTTLGSASVNTNGQATLTTASLVLGNHTIVAQYGGDVLFNPSVSSVLVQVVNTKSSASVLLTSSANPASLGQAVTFTATVTVASGLPTGEVTFVAGTTTLGSAVVNVNGQATFTTSGLTLGNHSIVALYGGDANFNPSTSAVLVQIINSKAESAVTLSSSANPASRGQSITLTATVTGVVGRPTGQVTFVEGATILGSASVNADGQATLTLATLTLGEHLIVAQYGGDVLFNPSTSAPLTQVINTKASASVALTSSQNPASLGQAITLTATVVASSGTPSGSVTFVDGATTLGTVTLSASGQASLTTANLALGEHAIVAQYSGDANVNPSISTTLTQVINSKASTSVTLISSANPASLGQPLTFTATVTGVAGLPTGVVTLVEGNTTLGSAAINANGQATLTTSSLILGEHPIVAQYGGNENFNPSASAVLVQVINSKASTSVVLTSSVNPAGIGQAVTFTASVAGVGGTPGGTVTFREGESTLGSATVNANGQASFTTTGLALGEHPIVAHYNGDTNFNPSTSSVLVQVINSKASTSVTITSSVNPASVGQAVTFTVTVVAGSGTPSGSVTLVDGNTMLGSSALNANGQATFTTSNLTLGEHPMVAQYGGDANFNPSASAVLVQTINTKASTGVVLLSSENPAGASQAVTFTAVVSAAAGSPTGQVTFREGTTTLGSAAVNASGQATLTTSSLTLGEHPIVAQYEGDVNFNGSASAVLTQVINTKASAGVAITSSVNPASLSQAVTFTATVSGLVGLPTGVVTFVDGTTTLGSSVLNASGQATFTTSALTLGEHPMVALYSGDTLFNPRRSDTVLQVVNSKASTTIALRSLANPAGVGQAVIFTATVAGAGGTPGGTITFREGATMLGSSSLNANGQATFTPSGLALGDHLIVAQYSGDTNFNPSTSSVLVQVVNTKPGTAVTLSSSANPASVGQTVTFTATVAVVTGSGTPSGNVTFVEGTTTLGNAVVNASGQATFTTSSLALGNHPIAAQYSGDANVNPSESAVLVQVINTKASTSVTLTSSVNPASVGQAVTFTATVSATAGGTPSGIVTFVDGTTTLGNASINANGQATLTTSSLTLGEHPIVAQYGGDANFNGNTSPVLVQVVNTKASATVTLASSANPASLGQAITLTATVVASSGTPSGSVTFIDGATTLGTVTLTASGQATLTTASLALGNHPIAAQYSGDTNVNPSAPAVLVQVVNTKASTSIVLTSSVNPAGVGQSITLTARVNTVTGAPTGQVTFVEGATTLGSATVNANGQATFTTASLTLGNHPIEAQYGGDENFNPSASVALTQVINNKAGSTVALSLSPNPANVGQAVTFTATVTALTPGTPPPTGSVTLMDGATTLGSVALNANGVASFTVSNLTAGTHSIVVQYAGDATFNGFTSTPLTLVINEVFSDLGLTMTASANPVLANSNVTYTIRVSNNGPDAAPSVAVSNILPSALRITNCTATGGGVCSGQGNARVVNFPSLAAGATADITITASLGCNNSDVTLVNTATVTSLAVDRNPSNDAVTVTTIGQAGKASGTITYESGATALSLGPVVVGSNVTVPAGTGTFTLTNTGCLPMELTDAFFTRAVTATNLAGLDDSRYFTLRLVPSSGAEIALNPSPNPDRNAPQPIPIRRTVPSGGQLVFRVTFQPPVPFFAGAFEGLFANQVLPQQFDSRVIFNFVTGSTSPVVAEATGDQGNVTANLKASVDPKIQIVQRENEPLVSLTKTPTDFRVRVSLYDANKNGTLITYQFLNSAGQPATAPIELNLATLLNSSPLLPGQCFTLQQDFSGAANRPDITGVRVTVVDADGANVSATGNLILSLTASLLFLDAVISPDVLVSEPLRLGDISVAAPPQSISRPTTTNVRREK